jgi:hypothetical protein
VACAKNARTIKYFWNFFVKERKKKEAKKKERKEGVGRSNNERPEIVIFFIFEILFF